MGSIHLIRHGQASWGADDYDNLSAAGKDQSVALSASWEAAEWVATAAISGSLRRHTQTATAALDTRDAPDGYDVDERWNEYDLFALNTHTMQDGSRPVPRASRAAFNDVIAQWMREEVTGGETYSHFHERVLSAHNDAVDRAGSGQRVAVFTSGGPISLVVSHLLTGTDTLFTHLNEVIVNASVTTVISGESGVRLLSFNEHAHLPGALVTSR